MAERTLEGRLPPGQYLTRDLPVYHVGSVPPFDPGTWTLKISGLTDSPKEIPYREFQDLPRSVLVSDLHCVTTWSRYDLRWGGVLIADLLALARPLPAARYAVLSADGGYSTVLTMDELADETVLVADRLFGEPLSPEHGFPARLVVPKKYGYKSVKWLRSIEYVAEYRPGFWEARGYSAHADPFTEDRFAD